MTYLIVLIIILYCIFRYDIRNNSMKGQDMWFRLILVILVLISGLSYRLGGTDGVTYMIEFRQYSSSISSISFNYLNKFHGRLPGWVFICTVCKSIIPYYWFFKLIHALILNSAVFYTIRYCTKYHFSAILVYFVLVYFTFNFVILRQSIAIAFFLLATKYFFENKWLKYYLIVFLCMTLHDASFILLFFPLIKLLKINKITITLFVLLSIILIRYSDIINSFLVTFYISDDFSNRVNYYAKQIEDNEFSGFLNYGLNIVLPLIGLLLMRKNPPFFSGFVLSYMLLYIMGLSIPIMYRFGDFLSIYYFIFFVDLFAFFTNKIKFNGKRISLLLAIFTLSFVAFRGRMYFIDTSPGYPKYLWYYPYSSVIFEETYQAREECYRHLD